jgi:hypothetical protein
MVESLDLSAIRKRAMLIGLDASRYLDKLDCDPNGGVNGYAYEEDSQIFKDIFSIRNKYHKLLDDIDEILLEKVSGIEDMPKQVPIYVHYPALMDLGHGNSIAYEEARSKLTQITKQVEKIVKIIDNSTLARKLDDDMQLSEGQGKYDIFLCHTMEDKEEIANPLAAALKKNGIHVWYNDYELKWGKGLRQTIEKGLASSKYGIVLLSKNFLDNEGWAQKELSAILEDNKLLPIWCGVLNSEVRRRMPIVADIYAKHMDSLADIPSIVLEIKKILGYSNTDNLNRDKKGRGGENTSDEFLNSLRAKANQSLDACKEE